MKVKRDLAEAGEVVVCPTIKPRNPAVDEVEADVPFFANCHDLCGHGSREEERDVRKHRGVAASKTPCIATAERHGAECRQSQGGANHADIQPLECVFGMTNSAFSDRPSAPCAAGQAGDNLRGKPRRGRGDVGGARVHAYGRQRRRGDERAAAGEEKPPSATSRLCSGRPSVT